MKIGFVPAVPFFLLYGGGETQLIHPYNVLKSRGVDVNLINYFERGIEYDILHFFGLHYSNYRFMDMAKKAGIKVVLEPISFATKKQVVGRFFNILNTFVKVPTTQALHREMLNMADFVIPNSYAELNYLERYFNLRLPRTAVAYNAIQNNFYDGVEDEFTQQFGLSDYILCVGKIEPRKNQVLLAQLAKYRKETVVFIGAPVLDALDYFEEFCDLVRENDNIHHFMPFEQDSKAFRSAYKGAKIHVLLGDNETPGMASLEAAVAGVPIVVQECEPVREYFGDEAFYCNTKDVHTVHAAMDRALSCGPNPEFSRWCKEQYSWEAAAHVFQRVYAELV